MTPCTIDDVKSYDSPKIYKRHDGWPPLEHAKGHVIAELRARCERLAAVACRAIALRIPAWLEPQMTGVELEGARVCQLRDALLALQPGDTEEAK